MGCQWARSGSRWQEGLQNKHLAWAEFTHIHLLDDIDALTLWMQAWVLHKIVE